MFKDLSEIQDVVQEIYQECLPHTGGKLPTYIPELANVDPELFGISIVSLDGDFLDIGHCDEKFTFQSISKILSYALAMKTTSREDLNRIVGTEPSGTRYDSILKLNYAKRPYNPMINSGAIAIADLLLEQFGDSSEKKIRSFCDEFSASKPLSLNEKVWESERKTADRNRSIAYLLKSSGIVRGNVEEALDLYFKQCSVEVTARDLAMTAATLANKGKHPVSGKQLVSFANLRQLLSVMLTCGMYNYTGQWIVDVGLPAKSGVSGGVLAVVPGRMGIGIFSPRLDIRGSSVRGIEACRKLSDRLGLHILGCDRS